MPDDLDLRDVHTRHEPDPAFRLALRRQVQAIVAGASDKPTTTSDPSEEDVIMLTDTRTEVPGTAPPKRRWLIPAAAAAVMVAVVAGVALTAGDEEGDGESTTANSSVVFHDDFSDADGGWETLLDGMRVEEGHQVWTLSPGRSQFLRPGLDQQRLADTEVTAWVAATDPDSTLGVYCRKGVTNQDFYYFFRVAPQGAVIGVLPQQSGAPAQQLAEAPDLARPSGPFEITVRCVDEAGVAQLTMLIDGDVVLEATHDEPLPAGYGALEVQAGGPGSADSEVRWDEFTISGL